MTGSTRSPFALGWFCDFCHYQYPQHCEGCPNSPTKQEKAMTDETETKEAADEAACVFQGESHATVHGYWPQFFKDGSWQDMQIKAIYDSSFTLPFPTSNRGVLLESNLLGREQAEAIRWQWLAKKRAEGFFASEQTRIVEYKIEYSRKTTFNLVLSEHP